LQAQHATAARDLRSSAHILRNGFELDARNVRRALAR